MLKLIFKNLWARRRRNGWLLAELILVSVVTWIIIDPVVVLLHDRNLPLGYDAERVLLISLSSLQPGVLNYSEEAADSAVLVDDYLQLVKRAEQYKGVEYATPVLGYCYPNSQSISNSEFFVDSIRIPALHMYFLPETHYFETFGIHPVEGMSAGELSAYEYGVKDIIMTQDLVYGFYGSSGARGKNCYTVENNDTNFHSVVAGVERIKMQSFWRPSPIVFWPLSCINQSYIPEFAKIAVRLKPGISMNSFLHEFRPWMNREMKAGNLFARTVTSYEDLIANMEYQEGVSNQFRMNIALAVFFLVNLCLGVIGTFWLQTRVRREEVGVMLAFGGCPGYIVRLLLGEGVVLTFIAVLIGCFGYLQYALKEGLYNGKNWMPIVDNSYWVAHFSSHFLIVSLLVFLILLAVVLIGIYIPARRISRISPTEALRDE